MIPSAPKHRYGSAAVLVKQRSTPAPTDCAVYFRAYMFHRVLVTCFGGNEPKSVLRRRVGRAYCSPAGKHLAARTHGKATHAACLDRGHEQQPRSWTTHIVRRVLAGHNTHFNTRKRQVPKWQKPLPTFSKRANVEPRSAEAKCAWGATPGAQPLGGHATT